MTAILSQQVLPSSIQEQMHLRPDDDFEIIVEDEDNITLRRVSQPANRGLVDILSSCPAPFEIPPRERDHSVPLEL